nr:PREDICTED: F-box/LRR-repeat protein 8 isoform X1 [Lepisosteus oculatus]
MQDGEKSRGGRAYRSLVELPEEILAQIFSFLPMCDRYSVSQVCRSWSQTMASPSVWTCTEVRFCCYKLSCMGQSEAPALTGSCSLLMRQKMSGSCESGTEDPGFQQFCKLLRKVQRLKIVLSDLKEINNRNTAIKILNYATDRDNRLRTLCVSCTGEFPLFYSGEDILRSIESVCLNKASGLSLREVDFRDMPFTLKDSLIRNIARRSPDLQKLYINNQTLVCNVTAETIKEVLALCPKLRVLGVFYASLSEKVLSALLEPQRPPFSLLELYCERTDKYIPAISKEFWTSLCARHPLLSVNTILNHTLPAKKILKILQPGVPIKNLELITYTYLVREIGFVAESYCSTLEKLVLQTTSSEELNSALISLALCCGGLREIHCYCVVSQDVVQAFLSSCPHLWRYTLKTVKEPHPWRCTVLR